MIKVLVVDDSALIRKILTDILESDSSIKVIGTARNGVEALEKLKTLKPDLITLDVEMPLMDGLTTLKNIMKTYKIPVIMISTLTYEGAELTLKALEEGAIDFLPKPNNIFGLSQEEMKEEIIEKVKAGSQSKVYRVEPFKIIEKSKFEIRKKPIISSTISTRRFDSIVAIGTSTGGPRALQSVIPQLPEDINASIIVVQHMPPKFTKSLADRLNSISNIQVKEAEEGDKLSRGQCYIAPGDYHLTVIKENNDLIIRLNKEPKILGLRPTVDIMMDSISKINDYKKLGVVLTGMGSDGAKGIISLKDSGSYTIAQDEKSSVVFGMPKAAIATNCIDEILSLDKISDKIISKVGM